MGGGRGAGAFSLHLGGQQLTRLAQRFLTRLGGGARGGGPGSIYRVSYVNTDRNFNKLYFKHVSIWMGCGD